ARHRLQAILLVSPAAAAFIAMFFSAALLMSGEVRPGLQAFMRVCFNFIFATMIVFSALALVLVGQAGVAAGMGVVGRSFYGVYFVVGPVAGCAGALLWVAALGARSKRNL